MEYVFSGVCLVPLIMEQVWYKYQRVQGKFKKFVKTQDGFGFKFILHCPTSIIHNIK